MGFTKTLLKAGNGVKPTRGQNVTVHCTGYGKNRDLTQKFWSTKDAGQQPFTFAVGLGQGMETYSVGCASSMHPPQYTFFARSIRILDITMEDHHTAAGFVVYLSAAVLDIRRVVFFILMSVFSLF
jgi:hypothetical protein